MRAVVLMTIRKFLSLILSIMIFRHAAGMKHAIGAIMVVAGTALSGWPLQCIIIINSHINVNSLLLNYKLYVAYRAGTLLHSVGRQRKTTLQKKEDEKKDK